MASGFWTPQILLNKVIRTTACTKIQLQGSTHTHAQITQYWPCLRHYPLSLRSWGWCWSGLIRPPYQGDLATHKHTDKTWRAIIDFTFWSRAHRHFYGCDFKNVFQGWSHHVVLVVGLGDPAIIFSSLSFKWAVPLITSFSASMREFYGRIWTHREISQNVGSCSNSQSNHSAYAAKYTMRSQNLIEKEGQIKGV